MDRALIKKLSEAGVAPEVIVRLLLDDEPEKMAEPAPEPAPAPEPRPEPAPEPKPEPKPDLQSDKILAAIERLTGAVQASNIRNLGGPGPEAETVDDILAQVIAPKGGK